jgi:hypothetical protein
VESKEDFDKLKAVIVYNIEEVWGPRCEAKDTDEFDDLVTVGDPDSARCPVCLVYEKFDAFWKTFYADNMEVS